MNDPPHPAPVLRYLRRPLWWALGVAFLVLVQFGAHALTVVADASTFADAVVVRADASPVDPGSGVIDLTYERSDGQRRTAAVYAPSFDARGVQGPVSVEVSRTDPTAVRLLGDGRGWFDEVPYLLVLLVLPLASFVMRRRHVRHLDHLMAADEASYAMLGAVVAPDRLHPRWRLCLYPVDARPGSQPVGAVELIWLPLLPEGAFFVEVKGEPRPFGTVAVRAGDEILWPRGRSLAVTTKEPRPQALGPFPAASRGPVTFPVPSRPSLWPARALRVAALVSVAAYLWVGSAMTWRSEVALERSRPASGTVVAVAAAASFGSELTVQYDRAGGRESAVILTQSIGATVGATVPIRYDIADPTHAWEAGLAAPPDPRSDVILSVVILSMAVTFTGSVLVRRHALAELGVYELSAFGRVDEGTLPVPRA